MPLLTLTYNIEEIKYEEIRLNLVGGNLLVTRGYQLLDANGEPPFELAGDGWHGRPMRYVRDSIEFSTLPKDVQDALTRIDEYTKKLIKQKEGIQ